MAGAARARTSRLMAALDAAIKAAAHPIQAQCLRAERAALLARQGQLERAQGAIDELQAQLAWQPRNDTLRAWVTLASGLHGYYSVIGRGAQSTIEEAYALAHAGPPDARLRATAAAWLANMAFANDDMPRMATLVREALDASAIDHHGARARAALVAAYAYHFGARNDLAQPWYEASRRHAIAEGDEAHLSALMHNQAWMRASQARMALLFDDPPSPDAGATRPAPTARQALLGAESIGHYDAGIGTASLGSLVPMLRAQVLTAQGRWDEALALFDAHYDSALAEGLDNIACCLLADRAWCEFQLGRVPRARTLAAQAEAALAERPADIDDRALALARLAQVHEALGAPEAADRARAQAQQHLAEHRAQQRRIVELLDAALAGVDPAQQ